MMMTQNYRYTRCILTLKQTVSELDAVSYAKARYVSKSRATARTFLLMSSTWDSA